MISLKKYMDTAHAGSAGPGAGGGKELLPATVAAYRSSLVEMGKCGQDACPVLGEDLKRGLGKLEESLSNTLTPGIVEATEREVRDELRNWGRRTARHYREKTGEVKEILLMMARTAESVGSRDQRCAEQISNVTTQLRTIANLDDLTQIRASIEKSASELKTSIDRMTAEGKAVVDQLRKEVTGYQSKLEEAEQIASRDSLTGLRTRLCAENQIENRIESRQPFCVAILDIDGFKLVNDEHGHLVGDELLKQFATELKSASRATDLIGRWGGDEFILVLDGGLPVAQSHIDRLSKWVCGSYTIQGSSGPRKLEVHASIGLAEHEPAETLKSLVDRADAEMYQHKAISRAQRADSRR
jgi:diguanylate cyclase (GGDEF)-like protein